MEKLLAELMRRRAAKCAMKSAVIVSVLEFGCVANTYDEHVNSRLHVPDNNI